MADPIALDGSAGEGGGQILRTALSLAAITGRPFVADHLRARRPKPGLRPQHVAAARAVGTLCRAELAGDEVGSPRLDFRPTAPVTPGDHDLDVGTAGSTPLLFHAVAWPLALAGGPSALTLRGGTHQDHAPSFHHLALVWAPAMARLGFRFGLELAAAGFYPEGGGVFTARVEPVQAMPALELAHRGNLLEVEVVSMVCGLGYDVARRQADRALARLRELGVSAEAERVPMPARGSRGGHVLVVATFERVRSGHGAVSAFERSPEVTADAAVDHFAAHLASRGAVDPWLADQLLVPAALVAAGRAPRPAGVERTTRYTVSRVTGHLLTNAEVIRRFLDVEVAISGAEGEEGEVRVAPRATASPAS